MTFTSDLSSLLDADIAMNVTLTGFLLVVFASIVCGLLLGGVYTFHKRQDVVYGDMAIVMAVVPVAAAVVVMMVGRNIAAGLGLSGIFVLVRFRSGPVESKDLAYLFAAICSGVLVGCGFVIYGLVFTLIIALLVSILELCGWGRSGGDPMLLKIWVPESLNFQGVFDAVLRKYTEEYKLLMVRTTDFGSNCELRYRLIPKKGMNQKELLDDIRVRNGNMNVVLIVAPQIVERNSRQL